MRIEETIKRILREDTQIPSVIKRRVTNSDIEEAFLKALDLIDGERLYNQFSPVKNISLKTFAKLVIDEMVTSLEQDYFSDENRIYFDNDETYHPEIRVPLMNYFGDRIKKRYNSDESEEEELIEGELTEKCWAGYTQKGMKTMFGKRYPNCVKKKKK